MAKVTARNSQAVDSIRLNDTTYTYCSDGRLLSKFHYSKEIGGGSTGYKVANPSMTPAKWAMVKTNAMAKGAIQLKV